MVACPSGRRCSPRKRVLGNPQPRVQIPPPPPNSSASGRSSRLRPAQPPSEGPSPGSPGPQMSNTPRISTEFFDFLSRCGEFLTRVVGDWVRIRGQAQLLAGILQKGPLLPSMPLMGRFMHPCVFNLSLTCQILPASRPESAIFGRDAGSFLPGGWENRGIRQFWAGLDEIGGLHWLSARVELGAVFERQKMLASKVSIGQSTESLKSSALSDL